MCLAVVTRWRLGTGRQDLGGDQRLRPGGQGWSRAAGQIAVLVLAVLRHDQRATELAGGNGVWDTTIRRWCDEVIAPLAARCSSGSAGNRPDKL